MVRNSLVILLLLLAACAFFSGCSVSQTNSTTGTSPTPVTPVSAPSVAITSPRDGAALPPGDITVSVQVTNFRLVPSFGQAAVPGEGHLHYFLDLPVPLTDETAGGSPGHFVPSTDTSFTFPDVPPGTHNFSVELANNDHSPFPQPVFSTVTVTCSGQVAETPETTTGEPQPDIQACKSDSDCVPNLCCHPTNCINRVYKGVCTELCTNACLGPLDCGAGSCGCINGKCAVVPRPGGPQR